MAARFRALFSPYHRRPAIPRATRCNLAAARWRSSTRLATIARVCIRCASSSRRRAAVSVLAAQRKMQFRAHCSTFLIDANRDRSICARHSSHARCVWFVWRLSIIVASRSSPSRRLSALPSCSFFSCSGGRDAAASAIERVSLALAEVGPDAWLGVEGSREEAEVEAEVEVEVEVAACPREALAPRPAGPTDCATEDASAYMS